MNMKEYLGSTEMLDNLSLAVETLVEDAEDILEILYDPYLRQELIEECAENCEQFDGVQKEFVVRALQHEGILDGLVMEIGDALYWEEYQEVIDHLDEYPEIADMLEEAEELNIEVSEAEIVRIAR
ncbi:hypothetical protein M2140_000105 [Clostridiales Family XIII bacterium PM5-7]